jgi:hypothetical protein
MTLLKMLRAIPIALGNILGDIEHQKQYLKYYLKVWRKRLWLAADV